MNNQLNGYGRLFCPQTNIMQFEGNWVEGALQGEGQMYCQDTGKRLFDGIFKDGQLHNGTYYFPDETYVGDIRDNLMHGFGKSYDKHGKLIYEGHFANHMREGFGKYYNELGRLEYEGMHEQSVASGYGKQYDYSTGSLVYEGNFKNGVPHGEAKMYCTGTGQVVFDGEWHEGSMKYGRYWWLETEDMYEGPFEDNLCHGIGKQYVKDKLWVEGTYVKGQLTGPANVFNLTSGEMTMKATFENGKLVKATQYSQD